jgi:hypothetical protein
MRKVKSLIILEIKFIYYLNKDNIVDVVRELQKAINLSDVEYNVILDKLSYYSNELSNLSFKIRRWVD